MLTDSSSSFVFFFYIYKYKYKTVTLIFFLLTPQHLEFIFQTVTQLEKFKFKMSVEFFQILPKNINGLAKKKFFLIPFSNLLLYHCRLQIPPSMLFCPHLIVCGPLHNDRLFIKASPVTTGNIWPSLKVQSVKSGLIYGFYNGKRLTHCP